MVILGLSHHTWWTVLGVTINVVALTYYFLKNVPTGRKILLTNILIVLFAGICVGAVVFPLAGRTKIFALGCVRGNGAALLVHLIARMVLRRSNER